MGTEQASYIKVKEIVYNIFMVIILDNGKKIDNVKKS